MRYLLEVLIVIVLGLSSIYALVTGTIEEQDAIKLLQDSAKSFHLSKFKKSVLVFTNSETPSIDFLYCTLAFENTSSDNCIESLTTDETENKFHFLPKIRNDEERDIAYYFIERFYNFSKPIYDVLSRFYLEKIVENAHFKLVFILSRSDIYDLKHPFMSFARDINNYTRFSKSISFLIKNGQQSMIKYLLSAFNTEHIYTITTDMTSVQNSISSADPCVVPLSKIITHMKYSQLNPTEKFIKPNRNTLNVFLNTFQNLTTEFAKKKAQIVKYITFKFNSSLNSLGDVVKSRFISEELLEAVRKSPSNSCLVGDDILAALSKHKFFLDTFNIKSYEQLCEYERIFTFSCCYKKDVRNLYNIILLQVSREALVSYSHWEQELARMSSFETQNEMALVMNNEFFFNGSDYFNSIVREARVLAISNFNWKTFLSHFLQNISYDENNKIFLARGRYLMIHRVIEQALLKGANNIEIVASEILYVSQDLLLRSTTEVTYTLYLATPILHIETDVVFDLSGENGSLHVDSKASNGYGEGDSGSHGRHGNAGASGGSLFMYAPRVTGNGRIRVDVSGGHGGPGQDGGDGVDGRNGVSPILKTFSGQTSGVLISSLSDIIDENKRLGISFSVSVGFHLGYMRQLYTLMGTAGSPGGRGGNGGNGGTGGSKGQVSFYPLHGLHFTIIDRNGESGTVGQGGLGGAKGKDGSRVRVMCSSSICFRNPPVSTLGGGWTRRSNYRKGRKNGTNGELASNPSFVDRFSNQRYQKLLQILRFLLVQNTGTFSVHKYEVIHSWKTALESSLISKAPVLNYIVLEATDLHETLAQFKDNDMKIYIFEYFLNFTDKLKQNLGLNSDRRFTLNYISATIVKSISNLKNSNSIYLSRDIIKTVQGLKLNTERLLASDWKLSKQEVVDTHRNKFLQPLMDDISKYKLFLTKLNADSEHTLSELDSTISKVRAELDSMEKDAKSTYDSLSRKRKELIKKKLIQTILNVLNLVGQVASFFGSVAQFDSQAITKAISIGTSIAGAAGGVASSIQSLVGDTVSHVPDKVYAVEKLQKERWWNISFHMVNASVNTTNNILLSKVDESKVISKSSTPDISPEDFSDNSEIGQVERAMKEKLKEIDNIIELADSISNTVKPVIHNMKQDILQLISNWDTSKQTSSKIDVTNYEVRKKLKEVSHLLSQMTKGLQIQSSMEHTVMKLQDSLLYTIEIYNKIESNKDKKRFADYIADVASSEYEVTAVSDINLKSSLAKLKNVLRKEMIIENYNIALENLKQWLFPFASYYLNDLMTYQNLFNSSVEPSKKSTDVILHNIDLILDKILKYQNSIVPNHDNYLFKDSCFCLGYHSSHPFYIWKYRDFSTEISNFLKGYPTIFETDVRSSRNRNAIKFKVVKLKLFTPNTDLQAKIDYELKHFDISLTHYGDSRYRCGSLYYIINGPNQTIEYSFETKDGKEPLRTSGVYDKMKDGSVSLSPYATWQFQLKNKGQGDFAKLYMYRNNLSVVLEGEGTFVSDSVPVCQADLSNYYQIYNLET